MLCTTVFMYLLGLFQSVSDFWIPSLSATSAWGVVLLWIRHILLVFHLQWCIQYPNREKLQITADSSQGNWVSLSTGNMDFLWWARAQLMVERPWYFLCLHFTQQQIAGIKSLGNLMVNLTHVIIIISGHHPVYKPLKPSDLVVSPSLSWFFYSTLWNSLTTVNKFSSYLL